MARGVVSHLASKGLKVPWDISVAAFDRTQVCEEEHPMLTGAATSPELMGRTAAEILLELKGNDQTRFMDIILSAELQIRESTGPVATPTKKKKHSRRTLLKA